MPDRAATLVPLCMLNMRIQLAYVKALLKRSYLATYTPAEDISVPALKYSTNKQTETATD